MARTTAVTKTETPKTPAITRPQMPAFMQEAAGRGTEDWSASDYTMPRLLLLQGISPELQQYDGTKAGDFFHTTVEQDLGPELEIVPIHFSKRYVLWRPRPPIDQGGILARADDAVHWDPPNAEFTVKIDKKGTTTKWKTARTVAESGLDRWGTYDPTDPSSQPAATECHVIVVALPEHPELSPVALFLQRSGIGAARKLRGKLKFSRAPIYGTKLKMSSFVDTSPAGQFNNYVFTAAGFVEDEAEYHEYEQMHEQFSQAPVQIRDIERAQETDTGGGETAAAEAAAEKNF